mgnify:CR=1 FL=1
MTQNTNLNVSPYFDDFNESKNYSKVLFKPGFPVQARELTTLQSILQNQVERFGQHFFKEGSIVIPGSTFYDPDYSSVKIDPNFVNIPVRNYTQALVDGNIEIQGETSGVRATVVNRITSSESIDDFDTLYVKYNKSGDDGETRTFQNGENLITLSDINFSNTNIAANNQFARCIVSNATSIGSAFSISEGVFFIRGYFVRVPSSTVILDQYTNSPSYRVGLLLDEEIVTPSNANSDLFDNARGFSNESAPGADRFKISTSLSKKSLDDNNDLDFVELLRIEDGIVREQLKKTDYNIFKDELARRTYDESGDYYIKPFNIDVRESLNDKISNRGVYSENQTTQNGNTPSDDIISLQVSPGKAYVRGYEVDKVSTSSVDIVKPRTTRLKENVAVPIRVGNYINVNSITGAPAIGFSTSVNLLDRRLNTNNDDGLEKGLASTAVVIGKARVYDFKPSINSLNVANTVYETRLFDIQTFTNLGIAATTAGVGVGTHIKGKYSGASGFIESMGANDLSFNLNDVKGSFQLNEPILVSGLEVGSNVTSIFDYDFTAAKAIHSLAGVGAGNTSFAANLVLDRKRNVFEGGSEFNVVGNANGTSVVSGGGIGDYRELVKVGDMFTYSASTNIDPVFNRITAVTKSNFSTAGVSTVTGECDGSTANNSPTGINIVDPTLNASDDPGYRIKLANNNIASLNLLDSSYVVRKQITKTLTSTNTVAVFNISDLGGVHTDLYFEPFSPDNYFLTIANIKEGLRASQVVIDNTLKTLTISGLSRTGSATLTATVKRSKLSSKDKTLTRCSNLVINRSKYSGSGITTTTFNDGLTYSTVYGTRAQDDEISLNVPDLERVLAVFESDDGSDPTLPSITATSQSTTFTNNVIIGEQLIGATSGAVGRVVSVDSGTKISFVYENDKFLEKDEQFTLQTSGIFANVSVLGAGDRDITKSYDIDNGQRYDFADYGRIVRKKDIEEPTRRLRIVFDYYATLETSGVVESINSYNDVNYSNEIPFIVDKRASDILDLRPRVPVISANPGSSPFNFYSRRFNTSGSENVVSNKTLIADYSYYQGRVDRLYLTKDGKFEVKKGQPSDIPQTPLPNDEAFAVAVLNLPPYVYNATQDVSVRTIPHKRYTMRDINSLEHRIRNLEDYTTLSLLETDTKNLSIKDPNTGLDKFKSGFFVDNFRDHTVHNLTGESYFDLDMERGECRPRSTERNVGLGFETKLSQQDPVNADYRWITDFADDGIVRRDAALLLNFESETFVNQPFATRTENLNPFHIANYAGSLTLNPEQDFWIEEVPLGTPDVFRIDSTFNAIATMLGVEDRENGGMAASMWNSHEITWGGRDLIGTDTVATRVLSRDVERQNISGGRRTTTTTTTSNDVLQTFERSGIEREMNLNLSVGEEVIDLGTKVVGTDIIHNTRTRNIEIVGKRLKPNTKYYVFMENTDVTAYCVPKLLPITMTRGSFEEGDIIQTSNATIGVPGVASILFRAAQSDHKIGPFNAPTNRYQTSPYDNSFISSEYSSSSSILNIDTAGLAMHTKPDHLGWVKKGMPLSSRSGNGEAVIGDLSLMSDDKGSLILSLHIPDPKVASNPKFTTGESTIRLTTSPVNANILDPGGSSAETTYFTSGTRNNTQEQAINIKSPIVDRRFTGNEQDVTRIETNLITDVVRTDVTTNTQWYDPLAQSFMVDRGEYQDGIFITGGDLYFKSKDSRAPVTVQIRTMRDGSPTTTILPFGQTEIDASNVNISDDASAITEFAFNTPVFLQSGYEYALVLITTSEKYNTFITRMGEEDVLLNSISNTQPYLGSLFKSQNSSTWTPSQLEDLKFTLKKAKFVTNKPSIVLLDNVELNSAHIRRQNPVFAYSKRANVSIGITDTAFTLGNEVKQTVSGVTHTGRIFAKGGPINYGTTSIDYVSGTGIGLTNGTFTGIGFTSLTGYGGGAQATVTVGGGVVTGIEITTNGSGYAPGDLISANALGSTGTGVRAVVGVAASTNLLVVDNISSQFVDSQAVTYTNSSGANTVLPGVGVNVNNDTIRDGTTMLFDHHNHGMHSSQNKVKVEHFKSDVPTTTLSAKVEDDSTTLSLTDGTLFGTFEDGAVGVANTGYVKIDNEILSYTSITGNEIDITAASRAIDESLKSIHESGTVVEKYEFNGVSLRKINKEHDISDKEKGFNSYYIELADKTKPFNATKAGGGDQVKASQNIPFEIIDPRISTITPTGTDVTARIKTTSGTSLSGNEASFTDKGYENVSLNKLNYLDDPRIVASKVNEYGILGGAKSFGLELTLSTRNEHVSPVVDLDTANIVLISNLINNKVTDYTTDSRPRVPGFDPNSAIYETKRINLEFPSNSIQVMFDGHRDAEAEFRVFYKLFRNDAVGVQQNYIPFNTNGLSDKTVNPNTTLNAFSEYKYTAENTPQFNGFMIKVVMTANTQANPPRFKNFRSIALRSFEIT